MYVNKCKNSDFTTHMHQDKTRSVQHGSGYNYLTCSTTGSLCNTSNRLVLVVEQYTLRDRLTMIHATSHHLRACSRFSFKIGGLETLLNESDFNLVLNRFQNLLIPIPEFNQSRVHTEIKINSLFLHSNKTTIVPPIWFFESRSESILILTWKSIGHSLPNHSRNPCRFPPKNTLWAKQHIEPSSFLELVLELNLLIDSRFYP